MRLSTGFRAKGLELCSIRRVRNATACNRLLPTDPAYIVRFNSVLFKIQNNCSNLPSDPYYFVSGFVFFYFFCPASSISVETWSGPLLITSKKGILLSFGSYVDSTSLGSYFNTSVQTREFVQPLVVNSGKEFGSKFGTYRHSDLIGLPYGSKVGSRTGRGFIHVLRPTPELWTMALPHRTQILYLADIAFITSWLNIKPGSKVIEAGKYVEYLHIEIYVSSGDILFAPQMRLLMSGYLLCCEQIYTVPYVSISRWSLYFVIRYILTRYSIVTC
jgi:hypothetical protein